MINSIWFKIIAGKINTIPEFYMIFARNDNEIEAARGQMFEAETETKASRPRPNLWGRRQNFGLEATLASRT